MIAHVIIILLGIYWIATGIGMLMTPNRIIAMVDELEQSPALAFMGGAFMLFAGGGVLSVQHSFSDLTEALATLFAAVAMLEGLLLVAWPKPLWALAHWMMPDEDHLKGFGLVTSVLGLVAIVMGAI